VAQSLRDGDGLAPYAAVSSEWQAFVEKKTFHSITLTSLRLQDPGCVAIVNRGRKLDLVRHIHFSIRVQGYSCPDCEEPEADEECRENANIISGALQQLFAFLSTWEPRGSLTLDINVQSPSDSSHHFKYIDMGDEEQNASLMHNRPNDPHHGWVNGRQVSLPPDGTLYRLFADIEFPVEFWQGLPFVTAVTSLVLRRQTRRRWEPSSVEQLFVHLTGLHEFHYEPWREWVQVEQRDTDDSKMAFTHIPESS
jgi:hypothetical protein